MSVSPVSSLMNLGVDSHDSGAWLVQSLGGRLWVGPHGGQGDDLPLGQGVAHLGQRFQSL